MQLYGMQPAAIIQIGVFSQSASILIKLFHIRQLKLPVRLIQEQEKNANLRPVSLGDPLDLDVHFESIVSIFQRVFRSNPEIWFKVRYAL